MKPYCTLFMLQSVDGKISTGKGAHMDFDADLPRLICGINDYYAAEKKTDTVSMISGLTCAKLGANTGDYLTNYVGITFVLVDSQQITETGVNHIAEHCNKVILVTDNSIPKRDYYTDNIEVWYVNSRLDVATWVPSLYTVFGIERITVQTGGTINASLLRAGMIDELDLFIAPIIVGGIETPSLVGGESFTTFGELTKISKLELISCEMLPTSFMRMHYKVFQ